MSNDFTNSTEYDGNPENNSKIFETIILNENPINKTPIIKHLVISSGLMYGLSFYGAFKECCIKNVCNIDNIETIFATSAGSIIAVILSLKYEWDSMDNYLINRPWKTVFNININTIINAFQTSGILDMSSFKELFAPIFKGRDLSIDISLKEFSEITGIDFHFFTTNIDTFEIFDINSKSCPNWTVIEAVYASSAAPLLFQPLIKDGVTYADGAFLSRYPLVQCINHPTVIKEEILGLLLNKREIEEIFEKETKEEDENKNEHDNPENVGISIIFSPLFHYMYLLFLKLIGKISSPRIKIPHEISVYPKDFQLNDFYTVVHSKEERDALIKLGVKCAADVIDILLLDSK